MKIKPLLAATLLLPLLSGPNLVQAKVYMCVDPATGKTSFTDQACESKTTGENVRVQVANPGSHKRTTSQSGRKINKAWESQRDTSLSGRDYNDKRRSEQARTVVSSS